MKHCIIVKFKPGVVMEEHLNDIRAIFDKTKDIPGIHKVTLIPGVNLERGNRYDLMIEMSMEPSSLPVYDACAAHHEWKDKYGELTEKKCIFDYEA